MPDRFLRNLPVLLEELAPTRVPDYVDDLLGRTARARQRPGWTFLERWLPVSAVTMRAVLSPGVPRRAILSVALLLLALVVAGLIAAGSRPRLPEPFGLARNGLVAYAIDGDIHVADPVTGEVRGIVTGAEYDAGPLFSPDGTRLAFRRSDKLVVSTADGADPVVVTGDLLGERDSFEWAADSRSILVSRWSRQVLELYGATSGAPPTTLATGVLVESGAVRPPAGGEILFRRQDAGRVGLYVMDADGTNVRPLLDVEITQFWRGQLEDVRWSPDGSLVAFVHTLSSEQARVEVVNADGGGRHELYSDPAAAWVGALAWSPDGRRIAVERARPGDRAFELSGMAIGVIDIDDGRVHDVGPDGGAGAMAWSPDGTSLVAIDYTTGQLILIDPDDGTWRELQQSADSMLTWQRLAP